MTATKTAVRQPDVAVHRKAPPSLNGDIVLIAMSINTKRSCERKKNTFLCHEDYYMGTAWLIS